MSIITSCKNDLDVIDDYKETSIVYGLINFRDTTQYIRVQKAYLGEGNAYLMAQIADSVYQDTAIMEVKMIKTSAGATKDSVIRFRPLAGLTKDEGLFSNFPHIIYQSIDDPATPAKEDYVDKNATYKLVVYNKKNGQEISAITSIVKDVLLEPVSPLLYPSTNINLSGDNPFKTEVTFPSYGKVLNLTVKFNYVEYTIGSNFFENKTLSYNMDDFVASSDNGGQKFTYELYGEKFFAWLKTKIDFDPTKKRYASQATLDFIFTIGAEEFYNYYTISNSGALLNDVIPEYTNLSEGFGLFSSRVKTTYSDKKLNGASMDSLSNGRYTGNLFD